MKDRTLVHMIFQTGYISLRTVSRSRKSPHHFYILSDKFEALEHTSGITVHDINSFAVLHRDSHTGTVRIEITWLSSDGYNVSGYCETIILPYDRMMTCLNQSILENTSIVWKTLSIDNSHRQPQLIFKGKNNLHAALANNTVRRKLARALRDEFRWPRADRIEIYDDFMPYSFVFHEIRNGKTILTGGLILHNQDNMSKSYYGIHT